MCASPANSGDAALNPEQVNQGFDASLRRLQTDYFEFYHTCWPERYAPLSGNTLCLPPPSEGRMLVPKAGCAIIDACVQADRDVIEMGNIKHWQSLILPILIAGLGPLERHVLQHQLLR